MSELTIDRSLPGKITGRLKAALDKMVWEGLTRSQAAQAAGLKEHSLYVALRKAHVKAYYLNECEVLRVSGRARRLHRLAELAEQDVNRNAAVAAIKAAEGIEDHAAVAGGYPQALPGLVIVIARAPQPASTPTQIDVTPAPLDAAEPIARSEPVFRPTR